MSVWLRADLPWIKPSAVDREAGVIRGLVAAELGAFKSEGRGEFDEQSLDSIVQLGQAARGGLKSRFTHPGLSSDGLGSALGRAVNWRRDASKVRYDLNLDKTALRPKPGAGGEPLGEYVMNLAESDPGLFGSSLVLQVEREYRLEKDGTAKKGPGGEPLPPLWRPKKLRAVDIVDEGDAVHGDALSVDGLADDAVRQATDVLDAQFSGCDRTTVATRAAAYLSRYLDLRFGEDDPMSDELNATPKPGAPSPPKPAPKPGEPKPVPPPDSPREDDEPELSGLGKKAQKAAALKADLLAEVRKDLAAERADLISQREAFKKDADAARAEQRKQLATAKQARIDDFLKLHGNKIDPWELDESDPETAPLSLRNSLLRCSTEATITVGDKTLSQLDVELSRIESRQPQSTAERLHAQAKAQAVTPERKKELLKLYEHGRLALAASRN